MRITPRRARVVGWVCAAALLVTACSGAQRSAQAFCERLTEATGSRGVEAMLVPGDPARVSGVIEELTELHDRAPAEISATTRSLVEFFETYQQAARVDRRSVLADHEEVLAEASTALDDYALAECGLLLQRVVPTAVPSANPSIEAPVD